LLLSPVIVEAATNWCTATDFGGCWKFEDSGTPVLDETTNNNDCAEAGTIGYQSTGKYDFAIEWTEVNNSDLDCGDDASLELNPINFAGWIAPDSDGNGGGIDCDAGCLWDKSRHSMGLIQGTTTTEIEFLYHWGSGNVTWLSNADDIALDGTYTHVAVTYDSGAESNEATIYIDGVDVENDTPDFVCCGADALSGDLVFGISGVGGVSEFDGDFDDWLWQGGTSEMSSTDINEAMDSGVDGTQGAAAPFVPHAMVVKHYFNDDLSIYMRPSEIQ